MSTLEECKSSIDDLWNDQMEELCRDWAERILGSKEDLKRARKAFVQPEPLRAYTCVADVKKALFSLRFKGQTVAYVKSVNGKPFLTTNSTLKKANAKYFKYECNSEKSSWSWKNSDVSKEFRAYFKEKHQLVGDKNYLPKGSTKTASEHNVESLIIEEMQKTDRSKFNGTCHHIQPVMVAGCPLQCPLPISSSKGKVRPQKGNIDILARTKNRNLSVWELKKPLENLSSKAHIQAFAYAYTLLKMLRSDSGHLWYEIFGFNSPVPSSLTIEAVPVFGGFCDKHKREKISSDLEKFVRDNAQALICSSGKNSDRINFRLAFYEFGPDDHMKDPRNVLISDTYSYVLDNDCTSESLRVIPGVPSW